MKKLFEEFPGFIIVFIVIAILICTVGKIRNINEDGVEGSGLVSIIGNNLIDTIDTNQKQLIPNENIFVNSSFSKNTSAWSDWNGKEFGNIENETGYNCAHISSDVKNKEIVCQQRLTGKLKENTYYTVSGWVKTKNIEKGTNANIMFNVDGYMTSSGTRESWFGYGARGILTKDNTWEFKKWTFKTDEKAKSAKTLQFILYFQNVKGDIYFRNLKLEEGKKATPFTE